MTTPTPLPTEVQEEAEKVTARYIHHVTNFAIRSFASIVLIFIAFVTFALSGNSVLSTLNFSFAALWCFGTAWSAFGKNYNIKKLRKIIPAGDMPPAES